MKVTAKMVERALASWESCEPATRAEHMRAALEAALAELPEPEGPPYLDRMRSAEVRVAMLEAGMRGVVAGMNVLLGEASEGEWLREQLRGERERGSKA